MPPEYRQQLEELNNPRFLRLAWGGGVFLLILTGWLWWHSFYQSPRQVFWGTINNNLVISGVTKRTQAIQSSGSLDQYVQLSLGVTNLARMTSVIEQGKGTGQHTKVATETIGTPTTNFNRYVSIEAADKKTPSFAPVLNVWSRQTVSPTVQGAFSQAVFDVIPFARLSAVQRRDIVNEMQHNNVYTTDFSKMVHKTVNGKKVYEYKVAVAPSAYITTLKHVDKLSGIKVLGSLDPSQYQDSNAISVTLDIDPVSHQLVRIINNGQTVDISAYGIPARVVLPIKAIPQADLQTKLSSLLSTP
jgi:hypothetical protein